MSGLQDSHELASERLILEPKVSYNFICNQCDNLMTGFWFGLFFLVVFLFVSWLGCFVCLLAF